MEDIANSIQSVFCEQDVWRTLLIIYRECSVNRMCGQFGDGGFSVVPQEEVDCNTAKLMVVMVNRRLCCHSDHLLSDKLYSGSKQS